MFSTQQSTTHHLILLITFSLVQRVPISEITRLQVNVELVDVFFIFVFPLKKRQKFEAAHVDLPSLLFSNMGKAPTTCVPVHFQVMQLESIFY